MKVVRVIEIDAPATDVWDVLGTRYSEVHEWATPVHEASGPGLGTGPALGDGRTCVTSIGNVQETIVDFDAERHRLSYEAKSDGMPRFVRQMVADWVFIEYGPMSTTVRMTLTMDVAPPFNLFIGPVMKLQMGRMIGRVMKDLKVFVETGRPSKIKARTANKRTKKAALNAA